MAKSPREKYYRIGEISRLYKISTDILRYYDKIGLMSPDFIGENGYRYYSKKQIWKLNNIRNLRNIGVGPVSYTHLTLPTNSRV